MAKIEPNIPYSPRNGAYGNDEVVKAYKELYKSVHEFMDEIKDDSSFGNISLHGVATTCRARAKNLVYKAKAVEDMMKAVCTGRR